MNEQTTTEKKVYNNPDQLNYSDLTEEEKERVSKLTAQIDIADAEGVLHYGGEAQTAIAEFAATALDNVRTKELGQVGDMLSALAGELRDFDGEKDGFLGKLLGKGKSRITTLKLKYDKAEKSVERLTEGLEEQQMILLRDIALLGQLYEHNLQNFRLLTLYIMAGKGKLRDIYKENVPALKEKAQQSGLPEDAQAVRDMVNLCDRFESKLHDLELTRAVALQMGPQLRLVQSNDTLMAEKIQSALCNTIPLWKSQMVIALGLQHSMQAIRAQREVTDITNALLRKNAEILKSATLETAKENQRGIVDIETLRDTNKMLIETLDEVASIQREGKEARRAATAELLSIENQLKSRLMALGS